VFENKGPHGFARAMLFFEGGFWGLGWAGGGKLDGRRLEVNRGF